MRASRLVSLLLLLQTRGQMTAPDLAEELEVSVRTVHRDVEALSEAGVPIFAERGPHGGIKLVDGYRTRLTGMTADEASALFLSGMPGPAAELGLGTVVTAARLKVLAALPPELRNRASRLVERFHLDASGWFTESAPVPNLGILAEAVWETRRIEISYDRGDRSVLRELEPLGLVIKAGIWYLVARTDGQVRTYRVSRVLSARLLDERFARPDEFDLASFWSESSAAYERDVPRKDVIARVHPQRLGRLASIIGGRAMSLADRLDDPDPEGWIRLRLRLEWPEEIPAILLGMGSDLEALSPPEIRTDMLEAAQRVIQRYAGGSKGAGAGDGASSPGSPATAGRA